MNAKWFKMDFIEKDKFRLTTIDEPLLDESKDLEHSIVSKTNKQKIRLKSVFKRR